MRRKCLLNRITKHIDAYYKPPQPETTKHEPCLAISCMSIWPNTLPHSRMKRQMQTKSKPEARLRVIVTNVGKGPRSSLEYCFMCFLLHFFLRLHLPADLCPAVPTNLTTLPESSHNSQPKRVALMSQTPCICLTPHVVPRGIACNRHFLRRPFTNVWHWILYKWKGVRDSK